MQAQSLLGWAQMLHEDYDDALANFSKVLMKEPANALARINVGYICLKKRIFGEAIEHLSKAIRLDNDRKATLYAHYYLGLVYLEREMYEDAQTFFRKTLKLGPNLIEAYFELGRALWLAGERDEAVQIWTDGYKANKFNPWAKRCQEMLDRGSRPEVRSRAAPRLAVLRSLMVCFSALDHARERPRGAPRETPTAVQVGQVTAVAWPAPAAARASSWPGEPADPPSGPVWAAGRPVRSASSSCPTAAGSTRSPAAGRRPGARRSRCPGPDDPPPRRRRATSTERSGTSWPTWPCIRRSRGGCRSGSMRATRRGRQASGTGWACSSSTWPWSAGRCRTSAHSTVRCAASATTADAAYALAVSAVTELARRNPSGSLDAAASAGSRRARISRPRCWPPPG